MKENFGSTAPSWIANPVLMSDVRGNITKDAAEGSSVLQTYIDSSIKNAVSSAVSSLKQGDIKDLQGQIVGVEHLVKENSDNAYRRFHDLYSDLSNYYKYGDNFVLKSLARPQSWVYVGGANSTVVTTANLSQFQDNNNKNIFSICKDE